MKYSWLLIGFIGLWPHTATPAELKLEGKWACALGVIRINQQGKRVSGKLIWSAKTCPFRRGDRVLEGLLLEDSLSGKWRYCLKGDQCQGNKWAPLVMLVARGGRVLSGAAHFRSTTCQIGGKRKGNGVMIRKLRRKPKKSQPTPELPKLDHRQTLKDEEGNALEEEIKSLDPTYYENNQAGWQKHMLEGKGYLEQGFFERARKQFLVAIDLDPTRPEAPNGVGVTYYARNDYQEALLWYKKSLEVDPDFQDAFYNMACIYSLLKKNGLALRYLRIALLNGYVEYKAMEQDADLENLRSDPLYKEISEKMQSHKSKNQP